MRLDRRIFQNWRPRETSRAFGVRLEIRRPNARLERAFGVRLVAGLAQIVRLRPVRLATVRKRSGGAFQTHASDEPSTGLPEEQSAPNPV